ncbi:MAG: S41 family peptidase [Saprospiraceae bacterium]|nr:S41 family peptidase [Saprospiraceae bacterium]
MNIFKKKKIQGVLLVLVVLGGLAFTVPTNRYFELTKNLEIFTNIYKHLNMYYVDDVDPSKMIKVGIESMLKECDPYTNYFSETQIETFRFMSEGKFNGIGIQVRDIDGIMTISDIYEQSPADKAGLKMGDKLIAIDQKNVAGKSAEDILAILQGSPNSKIDIQVSRPGESKTLGFNINRGEVDIKNVPYYDLIDKDYAYISLTTFTDDATKNIQAAYNSLKAKNPNIKGVILDLRENGGGLLREAVNICNLFIGKDMEVVTTKGKVKEWDQVFKTTGEPMDPKIPVTILINKRSASASEIVSGVIQDYDRGVIIGQRSYGKGLVQNTYDIGYNSRVKITTSKYYIPSGRCIQAVSYKDGEPVNIPDSLRSVFKTKGGRKVLDGGGVTPDILVSTPDQIDFVEKLNQQNLIFKYATGFVLKNKTIASPDSFQFKDYEDFKQFVLKDDNKFESEAESHFSKFLKEAKDINLSEGLSVEIKSIKDRLIADKRKKLDINRNVITQLLEKEIVSRYYLQKGKLRYSVTHDQEVAEAIQVMSNESKYQKILKK